MDFDGNAAENLKEDIKATWLVRISQEQNLRTHSFGFQDNVTGNHAWLPDTLVKMRQHLGSFNL